MKPLPYFVPNLVNRMKAYPLQLLFSLLYLFGGTASAEELTVRVGYQPNLWFAQPAVIIGSGWDKSEGLKIELSRFPGPPAQVQGFVAGQIDVMLNNVGSILFVPDAANELVILASTIKDDIFIVAHKKVLDLRETRSIGDTVTEFAKINGRRLKIAANPKGTMSDMVLRYGMASLPQDVRDNIEIVNAGDQAQLQQLFLSEAVDAQASFEPLYTVAKRIKPEIGVFITPRELMADQPGGVLVVRKSFLKEHPKEIATLLRLHRRATDLLKNDPLLTGKYVSSIVTQGILDESGTVEALRAIKDRIVSDPAVMVDSSIKIVAFMREQGVLKKEIDVKAIFDLNIYNAAISGSR